MAVLRAGQKSSLAVLVVVVVVLVVVVVVVVVVVDFFSFSFFCLFSGDALLFQYRLSGYMVGV